MSPKQLTDADVVRIFREEYGRRKAVLNEKLDLFLKIEKEKQPIIGTGLKIVKVSNDNDLGKKGQLCTVDQIGSWGAILSYVDEEGEHTVKVDKGRLEKEFEL